MDFNEVRSYPKLSEEFNAPGHWFTSYPSLNHWTEDFRHPQYVDALVDFKEPLHLYAHIPYCAKLCHYCICNVLISNDRGKIQHFLDHLLAEIDLLSEFSPNIRDVHLGGGTPSHLDRDQFSQLVEKLDQLCDVKWLREFAMEIDPRTVDREDLKHYAAHHVTRISFGVQDFDPKVQQAINRVQPYEMVRDLLTPEIRSLFKGINFDLLYGLPHQTHETVERTIKQVLDFRPERITLLKYCHAPEVRRHMRLINTEDLPSADELPIMFLNITQRLMDSGYEWVGLDHFALPTDSLAKKVGRTFNGFTPNSTQMVGIGPTTTGVFNGVYSQAHYDLKDYFQSIRDGEFPILRGYKMTPDDLERRKVIFNLLCHQWVELTPYFNRELEELKTIPELCEIDGSLVTLTTLGRVLLRKVCKVFDVKDVAPEHNRIAQKSIIVRRVA